MTNQPGRPETFASFEAVAAEVVRMAAAFQKAMDGIRAAILDMTDAFTPIIDVVRRAMGRYAIPEGRLQSPTERAFGRLHNDHLTRIDRLCSSLLMEDPS